MRLLCDLDCVLDTPRVIQCGVHSIVLEGTLEAVESAARMDVDASIERLGGFEHRPVLRIIEVLAIGVAVQDEAVELELANGCRFGALAYT